MGTRPRSHLAMHKLVVNQVMLAMGLAQWRDSGQPIPEGDEARAAIRALETRGPGSAYPA